MTYFRAEKLCAGYKNRKVLENISFSIEKGTITGLLGANGSGKSTLLKSICNILPHDGDCFLEGERLEDLSAKKMSLCCGYIPQRTGISIDLPLLEVVLMGFNASLGFLEQPTKQMKIDAGQALEQVGLGGYERENFQDLSEGQKQLCILARTLIAERKLLLLDEPESSLDVRHRYHLMDCVRKFIDKEEKSALVCLHDPQLALNTCDTCLVLKDSQTIRSVFPKRQSLEEMGEIFSEVYGAISIHKCYTKDKKEQFVLLKEDR
ncbi:MAG TPA: ABC transporter ATP-binding protein [Lachnospiraceae bacterium]